MPIVSARCHRPSLALSAVTITLLALAACAPKQETVSQPAPAAPAETAAACHADAAQAYIGKPADEATVAQAQQAAGASGDVRVIKPGQPVTMDYRGERLNVEVDEHGVIVKITCG